MPDRRRVLALIAASPALAAVPVRGRGRGPPRPHDPRGEARPAHHAQRRLHRHRPGRRRRRRRRPPRRPGRQPLQPLGQRGRPAGAARRRSRRPASASRSSSASTSCTASAPSSRSPSPRPAPSTPPSGRRPPALAAAEAAAAGLDLTFAPMIDVARDPRWGRIAEGPGEDPHRRRPLRRGQGARLPGRGPLRPRRHRQALRRLRRQRRRPRLCRRRHLRPHARRGLPAALPRRRRGRRRSRVMPAFTDLAGVPADRPPRPPHRHPARATGASTASSSATTAPIGELIKHGVAADLAEAAALALNAGVDIDMMSRRLPRTACPRRSSAGSSTEAAIDAAVARVLALKERLGLFDDPYRRCAGPDAPAGASTAPAAARRRRPARSSSCRTTGALPLPPAPGRIALLGPLADAPGEMLGPWAGAGRGDEAVGVLAGLRAALPDAAHRPRRRRRRSRGTRADGIAAAVAAARASRPRHPLPRRGGVDERRGGEPRPHRPPRPAGGARRGRARHRPPGHRPALLRPPASSCPRSSHAAAAVLACWFPGSEAGQAVAALLTGAASALGGPARSPGRATSARCRSPTRPAPAAARRTRTTTTPASISTCPTRRNSPSATASPTPASPWPPPRPRSPPRASP